MKIYDFIINNKLSDKTQAEKAKYLCFYQCKESDASVFTITEIIQLFINAGYNAPNTSRLRDNLTKGKYKIFTSSNKGQLTFIPAVLQAMENQIGDSWEDNETIESSSELLEELKFCNQKAFLTKLIQQINASYKSNCYDACAVLLRRVFEVSLILAYQKLGIDSEIKNNGEYIMLEGIVRSAKNNSALNLSRIKNEFDSFRKSEISQLMD